MRKIIYSSENSKCILKCPYCKCILSYEESDIEYIHLEKMDKTMKTVICPECDKHNVIL